MTWAARLAALLIAALGVFYIVRAVMLFLAPTSYWAAPHIRGGDSVPVARAIVTVDPAFDPFYRDEQQSQSGQSFEDAPETTLNLTLVGRITGDGGRAILQTPDGVQRGYAVGEEIINGVTLQAINPGYIVILQNGAPERLTITDKGGVMSAALPDMPADIPNSVGTDIDFNPAEFLTETNITPVRGDDGAVQGYRITERISTADLSRYSLRSGDVITAVNGADITQGRPEFGPLFNDAKRSGRLELTVIREGVEYTRTVIVKTE